MVKLLFPTSSETLHLCECDLLDHVVIDANGLIIWEIVRSYAIDVNGLID
jgi:hypothetical protein